MSSVCNCVTWSKLETGPMVVCGINLWTPPHKARGLPCRVSTRFSLSVENEQTDAGRDRQSNPCRETILRRERGQGNINFPCSINQQDCNLSCINFRALHGSALENRSKLYGLGVPRFFKRCGIWYLSLRYTMVRLPTPRFFNGLWLPYPNIAVSK